ncbi:hypothetical protein ACGFYV_31760 [Streptomyces sp. NPDC048297]|uniref:hypothetical protein n=1 Tax=Streptomyces sp. NPDC048297 TaxID=3365531 RepID=UPI003719A882
MLALRLTGTARPAVQLRRLLVAAASAGTGFLLLGALGYAMGHPQTPGAAVLRLAWCVVPIAATVYLALAVARTDPGTRPRPGLSAVGLGPARLMGISCLTTALACVLGSAVALLVFLHLRGDLDGLPFDGAASRFLAADRPLPVGATLILLALVPVAASAAVALSLRPRDPRPEVRGARRFGRFGSYGHTTGRDTFGAYGRFGARWYTAVRQKPGGSGTNAEAGTGAGDGAGARGGAGARAGAGAGARGGSEPASAVQDGDAGPEALGTGTGTTEVPGTGTGVTEIPGTGAPEAAVPVDWSGVLPAPAPPREVPAGLPWGIALLAAGLAVQAYAGRSTPTPTLTDLPVEAVAVLAGWIVTAFGLVLAAPGLTYLCGRLLQSAAPGALRLLAGRVLMAEATRIGRPLGVICAVASAAFAMTARYDGFSPSFGPLSTLGLLVVSGCTLATLLTAAVEARQSRADTIAALLRLGAPATMLRSAAALRAGALLALFVPLTLVIANLAVLAR